MTTSTAAARREAARAVHEAFLQSCPMRQVMTTMSDKWASLVVSTLAGGSLRHAQLRSAIPSISQKMLTQTLRVLERDGLVERTVTAGVPVRVDYRLSDLGQSLVPVVGVLRTWADTHIQQVLTARERYDGREPDAGHAAEESAEPA